MRSLINRVTGCSSTFTCITLRNYIFELQGPVRRSMCRQYPVARPLAKPLSFRLRKVRNYIGHFVLIVWKKNFLAGSEEIVQTFPSIRKNRGATSRGFKQADGRRVASGYHVLACEIECKSRGGIKRRMTVRRNMDDSSDIGLPGNIWGVLRSRNQEGASWHGFRWAIKQTHQFRLPILGIGSEIAQVA